MENRLAPFHGREELVVGFEVLQLIEEELRCRDVIHFVEQFAQNPNALELVFRGEEIFAAGARTANVDGRENPLLSNASFEVQFLVPRALELFVDDLVHL